MDFVMLPQSNSDFIEIQVYNNVCKVTRTFRD